MMDYAECGRESNYKGYLSCSILKRSDLLVLISVVQRSEIHPKSHCRLETVWIRNVEAPISLRTGRLTGVALVLAVR